MSDANSYYQSLLQQGYDVNQATVYTKEHFPHFVGPQAAAPVAAPAPAAPAAAAPASSTDPMMMMMMMNQQNQQAMMQQQALLAQSQQNQQSSGPIVINNSQQQQQQQGMGFVMQRGKPVSTGYLLWCCCFLFICGVHRFYYNKPISGIIYVLTFGLFGFGQLYDLLVMPELAKSA
tara:strand:- start:613 stop:1140 length:528 start_codon:yes stop_codon:yes gene_type:complete